MNYTHPLFPHPEVKLKQMISESTAQTNSAKHTQIGLM